MKTVIQDYPPDDGNEWDCQCARCGSTAYWEKCLCYPKDNNVACPWCHGHGGEWWCMSPAGWCKANPVEGREDIPRGQIEWYCIQRERGTG